MAFNVSLMNVKFWYKNFSLNKVLFNNNNKQLKSQN
jgi:hypothetical protein